MKVILYSTPTCATCQALKKVLDDNKIEYKDIDVSKSDRELSKMVRISRGCIHFEKNVRVIQIDKNVVVGFNKEVLDLLNL